MHMRHSEKNMGFGVTDFLSGPPTLGKSLAHVSSPIIPWALIRGCMEDTLHHTLQRGSITSFHFPHWAFQSRIGIKDKNLNTEEVWYQIITCCCSFLLLFLKSVFIVLNGVVLEGTFS